MASVHFIGRRTRGATELRRTLWISLGAVLPLFCGHFAQVGLWAEFLVLFGALQTYNDAFYFSLVTFATLGYGDIVLAPDYRIFGALGATDARLVDLNRSQFKNVEVPRGVIDVEAVIEKLIAVPVVDLCPH